MRKLRPAHLFLVCLLACSLGGQAWSACAHCAGSQTACHAPIAAAPAIDAGCCCAGGCADLVPTDAPADAGKTLVPCASPTAVHAYHTAPAPRLRAAPTAASLHRVSPPPAPPLFRLYRTLLI